MPAAPTSAYQVDIRHLRRMLRRKRIDIGSLRRKVRRCCLDECLGMCCAGGVGLSRDEKNVIERLAADHRALFAEIGLGLPERIVETVRILWLFPVYKTCVRPHPFRERLQGFPDHFPNAACVFMLNDGRCALQMVSERLGLHSWHYKPVSCWLQPLKVGFPRDVSLYLPNTETDLSRHAEYPGYVVWTRCGRTCWEGKPAYEVYREEILFLEAVTGVAIQDVFPNVAESKE
ncbi:DUF3109 family protein [Azospirillaceae bacterium]